MYVSQKKLNVACVPLDSSSAYGEKAALLQTGARLSSLRALIRPGKREERCAAEWLVPVSDSAFLSYRASAGAED